MTVTSVQNNNSLTSQAPSSKPFFFTGLVLIYNACDWILVFAFYLFHIFTISMAFNHNGIFASALT